MKKFSWILCILLLLVFVFSLSACTYYLNDPYGTHYKYKGMTFWFVPHEDENVKDYYYMAGRINDKTSRNYFIPMEINGYPVREFGYSKLFNTTAGSTNLKYYLFLQKLYMPGTIVGPGDGEEYLYYVHQQMQVYYCGEVTDMYYISPYTDKIDYYVPADRIDEFENALGTISTLKPACGLYKANIAYRLNSEDMCEYYYVDNIEAGSKIENIPPEPTRAGYKFGGWYTEKECTNKWNFDNAPTVSSNDDTFVEFALYAKWIKK